MIWPLREGGPKKELFLRPLLAFGYKKYGHLQRYFINENILIRHFHVLTNSPPPSISFSLSIHPISISLPFSAVLWKVCPCLTVSLAFTKWIISTYSFHGSYLYLILSEFTGAFIPPSSYSIFFFLKTSQLSQIYYISYFTIKKIFILD